MMNLILLSGGSGKRLWPLSNDVRSKQFIKIFRKEDGELESMVQRIYRQIKSVDPEANVTIATSKSLQSVISWEMTSESVWSHAAAILLPQLHWQPLTFMM